MMMVVLFDILVDWVCCGWLCCFDVVFVVFLCDFDVEVVFVVLLVVVMLVYVES